MNPSESRAPAQNNINDANVTGSEIIHLCMHNAPSASTKGWFVSYVVAESTRKLALEAVGKVVDYLNTSDWSPDVLKYADYPQNFNNTGKSNIRCEMRENTQGAKYLADVLFMDTGKKIALVLKIKN